MLFTFYGIQELYFIFEIYMGKVIWKDINLMNVSLLIRFTFWGLHVCRCSDVYSTVHTGLISEVTEKIFKIGSMEPGAMLFEASKEFYVSYIMY